ncbi:MAG: BON domain-containing protein, partial [Rhizobiaceae bacterium]
MRAIIGLVWALLAVILGWRAMTVKAPEIEADIRARTSAEVEKILPGVETDVDGRFVTLRGVAPDEAAKAKALSTADRVWGALGPYDGLTIPKAVAGVASWIGAYKSADGSLSLTGTVPSGAAHDQVVAAAKSAFTGAIDDRLDVAGNAASGEMGSLGDALGALSRLDAGSALVTSARTVVSGVTGDKAVAEDVGAMAANQGWSVVVNGPGAPDAPGRLMAVKTPDGAVVATGEVDSEATRKSVIDALSAGASSVVDRLAIRDGGLGADWAERASGGAKALAGLDFGSMALEGAKSFLKGVTAEDRAGPVAAGLGAGWTPEITARATNPDAGRIADLEAALAKAGDAARASDARIADLEATIGRAGEESAAAKARIAELEKALSDAGTAGKQIADLEKALADARSAAAVAAAEIDLARKRVAELEAQLA